METKLSIMLTALAAASIAVQSYSDFDEMVDAGIELGNGLSIQIDESGVMGVVYELPGGDGFIFDTQFSKDPAFIIQRVSRMRLIHNIPA